MANPPTGPRVLVLSGAWGDPGNEAAFVARSLAGAFSRHADVDLAVCRSPGSGPRSVPDGLFDAVSTGSTDSLGAGAPGSWLEAGDPVWDGFAPPGLVLVDATDIGARQLVRARFPEAALVSVVSNDGSDLSPGFAVDPPDLALALSAPPPAGDDFVGDDPDGEYPGTEDPDGADCLGADPSGPTDPATVGSLPGNPEAVPVQQVGLYVPINLLAAERRHYGLGFTGYTLVLSDRREAAASAVPTPAVAWLTAAFPELDLVVVEAGLANVWKGRARRGEISVGTRADLDRLIAHARVTIDLSPGPLIARECVEAMRFGVPIIVPVGTVGERHARHAGRSYADVEGLLAAAELLADPATVITTGTTARLVADRDHGDPARFVAATGRAIVRALALRSSRR